MNQSRFPPGWDEKRVRRLIAHYEEQGKEEAQTVMDIPNELVPAVRELIANRGY